MKEANEINILSHSVRIVVLSHNSTLIPMESGHCFFCHQNPSVSVLFSVLRPVPGAPETGLF